MWKGSRLAEERTLVQSLTNAETKTTENENRGEYLPLSVREAKGFNTKDIEEKAPKQGVPYFGNVLLRAHLQGG